MAHTTREQGTILSAAIYNFDHVAHETTLIAAANGSRVQGLVGVNTPSFTTTRLNLQADWILLQSATGLLVPVLRSQPTALTCNLSTAGPVANGRDQAAAFSTGWLHFYFIWNDSALATIASLVPPPTGPTLPTGFTHWGYATTRRISVGSLLLAYDRGSWVFYQSRQEVVTAGSSTTATTVSLSSVVPTNALEIELEVVSNVGTNAGGAAHSDVFIRLATGTIHLQGSSTPPNANNFDQDTRSGRIPNIGTSLIYQWVDVVGTANINNRDVWIRVLGYSVNNGG